MSKVSIPLMETVVLLAKNVLLLGFTAAAPAADIKE